MHVAPEDRDQLVSKNVNHIQLVIYELSQDKKTHAVIPSLSPPVVAVKLPPKTIVFKCGAFDIYPLVIELNMATKMGLT